MSFGYRKAVLFSEMAPTEIRPAETLPTPGDQADIWFSKIQSESPSWSLFTRKNTCGFAILDLLADLPCVQVAVGCSRSG